MAWVERHKAGIWAFLVATAYFPGIYGGEFVLRWAVIALGAPLVCRFDPRRIYAPILWLVALGVAWAAFEAAVSPVPLTGWGEWFCLVILVGAFIAGANLGEIDDAFAGAAIGIGISSVICIAQWFGWNAIPQHPGPAGLFYNREILAEFAAPVVLWALLKRRWMLVAITAAVPVLTESRVAVLTVAVGLLFAWRTSWRIKLPVAVFTVFVGIASVAVLGIGKFDSAGQRLVLWGAAWLSMTFQGRGMGWFEGAHPFELYAHSDILQSIVELGVGSVLLLAVLPTIIWLRHGTHLERTILSALCVEIAVSFPLHTPAAGFLVALVAGVLARRGDLVLVGQHQLGISADRSLQGARSAAFAGAGGFSDLTLPLRAVVARRPRVATAGS